MFVGPVYLMISALFFRDKTAGVMKII